MGPFDPAQTQIHDVNPGDLNVSGAPNHFPDGGVFWTSIIPTSSSKIQPGAGNAEFTLNNSDMLDFIDVVNAIFRNGPAPVPTKASVDIKWSGTGERIKVDNDELGFAGQYENATATINWSVENNSLFYDTANSSEVNITHAYTAKVRNGSFYR